MACPHSTTGSGPVYILLAAKVLCVFAAQRGDDFLHMPMRVREVRADLHPVATRQEDKLDILGSLGYDIVKGK